MKRAAIWSIWTLVIVSVTIGLLDKAGIIPSGHVEEGGKVIGFLVIVVFLGVWFNSRKAN